MIWKAFNNKPMVRLEDVWKYLKMLEDAFVDVWKYLSMLKILLSMLAVLVDVDCFRY